MFSDFSFIIHYSLTYIRYTKIDNMRLINNHGLKSKKKPNPDFTNFKYFGLTHIPNSQEKNEIAPWINER